MALMPDTHSLIEAAALSGGAIAVAQWLVNLCFQIRSNSFAKRAAIAAEEQAEILKEQQKTAVGDNPMAVQSLRPILPKATTLYRTRWMPLICIGIFAIISLGLSGYVYNQNTDSQEQIDKLRGERDYAEARFDDLTAYRREERESTPLSSISCPRCLNRLANHYPTTARRFLNRKLQRKGRIPITLR